MISIFGGTGYIGSNFCKVLDEAGRQYEVVPRDQLKANSDHIVYLISTTDNYNVLDAPTKDIETNLLHMVRVLNENRSCKSITFISSWFVYGDTVLPAKESSQCNPKGFYSITKKCAEDLLTSFCRTYGIRHKIVRLANVYGRYATDDNFSKKKNALQYLINELKHDRPISLYHNGEFIRDYIHVYDACAGIIHVIDHGLDDEIYNLGYGSPIAFKDIIDEAVGHTKSTSAISAIEPPDFHKFVQVKDMFLDCSKIQALGFKCLIPISTGIKELCEDHND